MLRGGREGKRFRAFGEERDAEARRGRPRNGAGKLSRPGTKVTRRVVRAEKTGERKREQGRERGGSDWGSGTVHKKSSCRRIHPTRVHNQKGMDDPNA